MFVSVTRLRIRSWRFMPGFMFYAQRSRKQIQSSSGFIRGTIARDPAGGFWTITGWTDEKSMKSFRNSAAHLKAMPKLSRWCDEGSYVHWEQDEPSLPTAKVCYERLRDSGKLSRVQDPSAGHGRGEKAGTTVPALVGPFMPR
jgi:hypothetical protein